MKISQKLQTLAGILYTEIEGAGGLTFEIGS